VYGVNHENRVKFKTHGSRLHVSHPGEQWSRQELPIFKTLPGSQADSFQQPVARRIFQKAHQGLNLRAKSHHWRRCL
jgi:hypothetical protein